MTILTRSPERGRVKTRLARVIGDDAALALHVALARDTMESLSRWQRGRAPVVLALDGDGDAAAPFASHAQAHGLRVEAQGSGHLGDRVAAALARRSRESAGGPSLCVGTDAPTMDAALLDDAVDLLDDSDVVLAPAHDGGFVLIGGATLPAGALDRVPWGSGEVLALTRQALAAVGSRVAVLDRVERDVDRADDLCHLAERCAATPGAAPHVARWLASRAGRHALSAARAAAAGP